MNKYVYFYDSKISVFGTLGIAEENNQIIEIFFEYEIDNIKQNNNYTILETPLIKETWNQLTQYFNGKLQTFSIPLAENGTNFQNSVWSALKSIPYGETRTYKEIATSIGNPKASRAVGMANNKNPIPIIVPCHRVIGSNNKMIGYAGGLEIKEFLLNLEKRYK